MSDKLPAIPKKIGRPTKWSQEMQDAFVENIVMGLPIADCCALAHIHDSVYYDWLNWAEQGKQPYRTFADAIKEANAEFKRVNLRIINASGREACNKLSWFGAAWLLERRDRPNYGRYDERADLNVSIKIDPKALSDKLKEIAGEDV
jgi:hypothetical protein